MDTIFFVASKLSGALLRPDTWIILALASIMLALALNRKRLALWVGGVTLSLLLALAILPLGDLLLQPIERTHSAQQPLDQIDGIIVLGDGEDAPATAFWGQMQLNEGGERYMAALELARRFPRARLLFTGGSGALRDLGRAETSEAEMAGRFFRDQGIASERLLLEGQSRNTAENARLSLEISAPAPQKTWVLV
jgi:uncharacterized SAM-binding protein YcdF (DUF218 family)